MHLENLFALVVIAYQTPELPPPCSLQLLTLPVVLAYRIPAALSAALALLAVLAYHPSATLARLHNVLSPAMAARISRHAFCYSDAAGVLCW